MRARCEDWRKSTSRALTARPSARLTVFNRWAAVVMAPRGLRSSWDSMARNSSFWRSRSWISR